MQVVVAAGLDIAKNVFQAHSVDAARAASTKIVKGGTVPFDRSSALRE